LTYYVYKEPLEKEKQRESELKDLRKIASGTGSAKLKVQSIYGNGTKESKVSKY
jgi:hypothetical protein